MGQILGDLFEVFLVILSSKLMDPVTDASVLPKMFVFL